MCLFQAIDFQYLGLMILSRVSIILHGSSSTFFRKQYCLIGLHSTVVQKPLHLYNGPSTLFFHREKQTFNPNMKHQCL